MEKTKCKPDKNKGEPVISMIMPAFNGNESCIAYISGTVPCSVFDEKIALAENKTSHII